MRILPTLTLASLLVFLISGYMYFSGSEKKDFFLHKKKRKIQYKTFKSLKPVAEGRREEIAKVELDKKKNLVPFTQNEYEKYRGFYEAQKESVCLSEHTYVFEETSDYVSEDSWIYKDQESLTSFFNKALATLDNSNEKILNDLKFQEGYERALNSYSNLSSEQILSLSNLHTGCASAENLGVVILSAMEIVKKRKWNPNLYVSMISEAVIKQVQFDSYPSLLLAVGMLQNLNSSELLTEYQTYDLNGLADEIKLQLIEHQADLKLASTPDERKEIIEKYRVERQIIMEKLQEFADNLKARYKEE